MFLWCAARYTASESDRIDANAATSTHHNIREGLEDYGIAGPTIATATDIAAHVFTGYTPQPSSDYTPFQGTLPRTNKP